MKKLIWILATKVGLLWAIGLTLLMSADLEIFEPEEQERIKRGALFWEWSSPSGPLSMHYVEKGTGDKHIFLIHGFRSHTYTWKYLMDPLAKAGFHVWAVDLIGYGLSDKPDDVPYTMDNFVEQVKAFMEAKGISEAHIVGNSMGGGIALNFALLYPHRVKSLTLLNALGYPIEMPLYLSIGRYFSQIWTPLLGPTIVRCCLKQIVYQSDSISDEQVEAYCLPYRFPGGATATLLTLRQFDSSYLLKMSEQYPHLPHPVLVIWGDHDTLIPLSHYEKFIKDFPSCHRLLIPNCGHIPQEEAPQQTLQAMLPFFSELESSKAKNS